MITPDYVRTMAAYNAELNRRVYAAATTLSEAQRRTDGGAFWGSIHGTLSHLLWADQMWMSRLDGWPMPTAKLADSATFFDGPFDAMSALRVQIDERLVGWAAGVQPEFLDGETTWYSGATQRRQTRPRALLVTHLFNHQTHHRGQTHALLTRAGAQTGATDLAFVLG